MPFLSIYVEDLSNNVLTCQGLIIKQLDPSPLTQDLVAYPGEIVIRGLQLLILPVVFCSLVSGV